jgi:hypothetical protein
MAGLRRALLFGAPLAVIYLRRGITSWFAYWSGGLLCALVTAVCLILVSHRSGLLVQLNGFGFFIILYGVTAGTCVRGILFGFKAKPIESVAGPGRSRRNGLDVLVTKIKNVRMFALLILLPPIGPLVWLFIESHPDGIPSGPEGAIFSVLAFAISLALPLFAAAFFFAVPVALAYRRFHVTTWLACVMAAAANSSIAVSLLRATGQMREVLIRPAPLLAFVGMYGGLSAIILHGLLRDSKSSGSNRVPQTEA